MDKSEISYSVTVSSSYSLNMFANAQMEYVFMHYFFNIIGFE